MRNKKTIIWCVVAALLTALLVGVFANVTDGFRNWDTASWFEDERNPENLLKLKCYVDEREYTDDGLKIEIDPDGSITFAQSKDAADGESTLYAFATVTLNPGTYTYTGSPDGTSKTYKLVADYPLDENGTTVRVNADNSDECTFTLTERKEVTFSLFIHDEYVTEGTTVHPTLSAGDEAIDFYLD